MFVEADLVKADAGEDVAFEVFDEAADADHSAAVFAVPAMSDGNVGVVVAVVGCF